LIRKIQKAEENFDCFEDYEERRVHYGKTDSMGGIFNSDEGKGQEGKEAYLDGLL